jgi:hypothetical protein
MDQKTQARPALGTQESVGEDQAAREGMIAVSLTYLNDIKSLSISETRKSG